jgi:4-amino-4-deoxy-L-arabinose transferase-like glycosyltransferase
MWVLGYSLFIWSTVGDLVLLINPDLLVTASVLLAAGLLIRMEIAAGARCALYAWFGVCLGFGYLTKAILFPMAFVFLAMMVAISKRPLRRQGRCIALAVLIFIAVALPEIALLSHSKGRITFFRHRETQHCLVQLQPSVPKLARRTAWHRQACSSHSKTFRSSRRVRI